LKLYRQACKLLTQYGLRNLDQRALTTRSATCRTELKLLSSAAELSAPALPIISQNSDRKTFYCSKRSSA